MITHIELDLGHGNPNVEDDEDDDALVTWCGLIVVYKPDGNLPDDVDLSGPEVATCEACKAALAAAKR